DELSFIRYKTDYCGASSSPDHRVRKLIEFLKGVFSFIMATSWLLRIVLLLTTYDLAVDKFDFAPVQSPDMRSSRSKKILVQGNELQMLSVTFLFWGGKGNL